MFVPLLYRVIEERYLWKTHSLQKKNNVGQKTLLYYTAKHFTRNRSTIRHTILYDCLLLARDVSDPLADRHIDGKSTDNDFSIRHRTAEIVDFYEHS